MVFSVWRRWKLVINVQKFESVARHTQIPENIPAELLTPRPPSSAKEAKHVSLNIEMSTTIKVQHSHIKITMFLINKNIKVIHIWNSSVDINWCWCFWLYCELVAQVHAESEYCVSVWRHCNKSLSVTCVCILSCFWIINHNQNYKHFFFKFPCSGYHLLFVRRYITDSRVNVKVTMN